MSLPKQPKAPEGVKYALTVPQSVLFADLSLRGNRKPIFKEVFRIDYEPAYIAIDVGGAMSWNYDNDDDLTETLLGKGSTAGAIKSFIELMDTTTKNLDEVSKHIGTSKSDDLLSNLNIYWNAYERHMTSLFTFWNVECMLSDTLIAELKKVGRQNEIDDGLARYLKPDKPNYFVKERLALKKLAEKFTVTPSTTLKDAPKALIDDLKTHNDTYDFLLAPFNLDNPMSLEDLLERAKEAAEEPALTPGIPDSFADLSPELRKLAVLAQRFTFWKNERLDMFSIADSRVKELYRKAASAVSLQPNDLFAMTRDGWQDALPVFSPDEKPMATREASGKVMNALAPALPLFVGGSADLGPSNNTALKDFGDIAGPDWDKGARNLHFGVREHAMAGILNGMALSKAIIPFGGTFLIFSDYMRASMRLAALMELQVVYVLTHDSIGQGEDGATHQPVEQLAALRAMPNMTVIRPSDATETAEAWRQALLNTGGPTCLVLTRQKLPVMDRSVLAPADNLKYGAYVIKDCDGTPDILLIATGSEVQISLEAADALANKGVKARVISMPSQKLFDAQKQAYKDSVLPPKVTKRLAVEAASPLGWDKYIGPEGATICIEKFGASAPGAVMMEKYGFSAENIVKQTLKLLGKG